MIRGFFLFIFLFCVSYASNLEKLSEWINKYKDSLYISFEQINLIKELEEEIHFNGNLCKYKDKVKIVYKNKETQESQEILIDKNKALIYSPEDNTLILTKVDNSFVLYRLIKSILENPTSLKESFLIKETDKGIILTPKKESDFKKFIIVFNNSFIKNFIAQDKEGNEITITINSINICRETPTIKTNKNTEIIKQY